MATRTIIGEIDSGKVPVAKERFLAANPIPKVHDGGEMVDKYTFMEWVNIRIWAYFMREMSQGKTIIDVSNADNIIIQ